MTISHPRLRALLLRLLEEVESSQREDPELRAEVLLALNRHCDPQVLIALWGIIEEVEPRQEMLVVRLVRAIESDRLDLACHALIQSSDPDHRAIGYGVVAMRARRAGARLLAEALDEEIALVLKKGGRSELAPYSFLTCILAGLREFKDRTLDALAPAMLQRFGRGESDLQLMLELIRDARPEVAKLGYVALASRVMGLIHRAAYDHALRTREALLDEYERVWLSQALEMAPEIIEAVTEPGPPRMDSRALIAGRLRAVAEIDEAAASRFLRLLLSGHAALPSLEIERNAYPRAGIDYDELATFRRHSIAYLFAIITQHRPVLDLFIQALAQQGELANLVLERLLALSGEQGALNLAMAIVGYWLALDVQRPDDRAFRAWLERIVSDTGPLPLEARVDNALHGTTPSAFYAARLISSIHDDFGQLCRALVGGEPVSLSQLLPHLDEPRLLPVLYTLLRRDDTHLDPTALQSLGRAGLHALIPALRPHAERDPELRPTLQLLEANHLACGAPVYQMLQRLGLRPLDRMHWTSEEALERLGERHPLRDALSDAHRTLLRVFFFSPLPTQPLGERIATADFVIDPREPSVSAAHWLDCHGVSWSRPTLPPTPAALAEGVRGLPWGLGLGQLPMALQRVDGALLGRVVMEADSGRTRAHVRIKDAELRLDFSLEEGLDHALCPTPHSAFRAALDDATRRFGSPSFQGEERAYWFTPDLSIRLERSITDARLVESIRVVKA